MTSKPGSRHNARILALQALYACLFTHDPVEVVEASILKNDKQKKVDLDYYKTLFRGVMTNMDKLDLLIRPYLDRDLETVTSIERCILRLGVYELQQTNVPFQVILNEAVELNKTFGTVKGFKYVNGVLDKLARRLRAKEVEDYENRAKHI